MWNLTIFAAIQSDSWAKVKYLGRLILYAMIFFATLSVSYVALLAFVPVTVTPLKIVKLFENSPREPFRVRSQWVRMGNISSAMVKAVVATEDNFFPVHNGFDWKAIEKALEGNRRGRRLRGGSGISQQTAKNVFCYPSRTWTRKGFETYYTFLIEALWSKRRIMEVYLNVIETGPNVYGVEAPAKLYYKKKARDLNVYEASMIATVLPNPIRMRLAAPSSYMVGRAANVRSVMRKLPAVDFDDVSEYEKLYEKYLAE